MKKKNVMVLAGIITFTLAACGISSEKSTSSFASESKTLSTSYGHQNAVQNDSSPANSKSAVVETPSPTETPAERSSFTLNQSSDKHIQYINKYIGMNAAAVGYTSLGGDRRIKIGAGSLKVTYVTADGSYVGVDDEDALKGYVVTGQNIEPNAEVHIGFQKKDDGTEYDNLTEFMTYDQIDLAVKKTGAGEDGPALDIKGSPDKYTHYIRNYVGKNLGAVGYESLGGEYRDKYGDGSIRLDIAAEDGSYIDPSDSDAMKQYMITGQSIEPNSEMKYTFQKDSEGKEYSNLTDSQTYDAITLNVKRFPGTAASSAEKTSTSDSKSADQGTTDESAYQSIYNDYSKRMSDRVRPLIDEYNSETTGADITKKAEVSNKKVETLAGICNEGVEKMASQMLGHGDDYSVYSSWSSKLYDAYTEDANQIYNAYLSSAT